jgi:hypothetical protein
MLLHLSQEPSEANQTLLEVALFFDLGARPQQSAFALPSDFVTVTHIYTRSERAMRKAIRDAMPPAVAVRDTNPESAKLQTPG